jgi:predicted NAD/FAD-binding protein
MSLSSGPGLSIAVIGTGVSGLVAAWLLSRRHEVTVFEQAPRIGGHCNTIPVDTAAGTLPVDTGFIVYNPVNYPNLTALFAHLGVATRPSEMSFSVSRHGGQMEYGGGNLAALFAQPGNVLRTAFWSMLKDLLRFYRSAPDALARKNLSAMTLGEYLEREGYGASFRDNHLLPMAAAIWSAPAASMLDCSIEAFVRFFDNHGLLNLRDRPQWRTVIGGSKAYVSKVTESSHAKFLTSTPVVTVTRLPRGVMVTDFSGASRRFDHAVLATHADQAIALLSDADQHERRLLGAFRYTANRAVLHSDAGFMPRRRRVWSSWNYVQATTDGIERAHVTYWMNRLQGLPSEHPLFVTINPSRKPDPGAVIHTEDYTHPVFDTAAAAAQRELWALQGRRNTWFCGAYFGSGFHEDGAQAGLAVAEDLGGEKRPWTVAGESSRIFRQPIGFNSRPLELAS